MKIESRYRLGSKLLKIYSANGYLRGVLYEFKCDTSVSNGISSRLVQLTSMRKMETQPNIV